MTFGILDMRLRQVAGPGRGEMSITLTLAPASRTIRRNDSFTRPCPPAVGENVPIRQTVVAR